MHIDHFSNSRLSFKIQNKKTVHPANNFYPNYLRRHNTNPSITVGHKPIAGRKPQTTSGDAKL
jgi:hypothetical protein